MLETLCEWHNMDPVDSLEWERNLIIASYQDGKANPFILDCSLIRMYCPELASACQILPTNDINKFDFYLYPNLLSSNQRIVIEPNYIANKEFEIIILDLKWTYSIKVQRGNKVREKSKFRLPKTKEPIS